MVLVFVGLAAHEDHVLLLFELELADEEDVVLVFVGLAVHEDQVLLLLDEDDDAVLDLVELATHEDQVLPLFEELELTDDVVLVFVGLATHEDEVLLLEELECDHEEEELVDFDDACEPSQDPDDAELEEIAELLCEETGLLQLLEEDEALTFEPEGLLQPHTVVVVFVEIVVVVF
ncbi:uncharacterized protein PV09_02049 [Verruconis gallopava]|uniref:Uncharacterized protein n=1 Tax=Verruconis gallopava TaxID=253628 RepID=A0A0D1Z2K4_9PEZI|nr:uncharacterized protein PV09_02049 [Verruconis gallopava]KIW07182.1 hypothetical protein PV09_02049 [Verruconis gallopava]